MLCTEGNFGVPPGRARALEGAYVVFRETTRWVTGTGSRRIAR